MKIVILCGGGGSRLWPLSRTSKPKQFHRLVDTYSLLQQTVRRLQPMVETKDIFISTNQDFVDEITFQLAELPKENIITEPEKRDNSAAIGLSLLSIIQAGAKEDESVLFLPADHLIENEDEFLSMLEKADKFTKEHPETLTVFGVRPTYPATQFGYIKMTTNKLQEGVFQVEQFVEKPELSLAKKYVASWEYLWNLGMFAMNIRGFWNLFKTHLPDTYVALDSIKEQLSDKQALAEGYGKTTKTSIDFGIIEHLDKIAVVPGDDLGWTDVGNWHELKQVLMQRSKDKEGVIEQGNVITDQCKNTLIHGEPHKLIVGVGLENLVVVDTDDALLIVRSDLAPEIKPVLEEVKKRRPDSL